MDSLRQRDARDLLARARMSTDGSINRINRHFGIVLPAELVQLARHSRNYHAHFVSFGADYDSVLHVIRVNS